MGFNLKKTFKRAISNPKKLATFAAGGGAVGLGIGAAKNIKQAKGQEKAMKLAAINAKRQSADEAASTAKYNELQANARPGMEYYEQSAAERRAGVSHPRYEGTRDIKTGELLSQYKFDPYQGEATQKLKAEAFGNEMSPWAKMKLEEQQFQENQALGQAAKQQMQAQAQAQSGLMRQGGMGGGARTFLASQGAKNLMLGQQSIAGQGTAQRLGIQSEDLGRKQGLMGDFAKQEATAQAGNIDQMTSDITRKAGFDQNRYDKQMEVYGANQTAKGQIAAAKQPRQKFLGIF